ncbi:uncharacterized protein LOC143446693 [Clavelina lepadiformis]|uniref:uncharacterized protein LOC143446693 n=1 Tax=Clavelina lepadiformis TaxID=159417 RepID=UPI004042C654
MITMNSGDTSTSAVEVLDKSNTDSSSRNVRKKCAVDNIKTYPIYVAVKTTSADLTLDASVKATGSNAGAVVTVVTTKSSDTANSAVELVSNTFTGSSSKTDSV